MAMANKLPQINLDESITYQYMVYIVSLKKKVKHMALVKIPINQSG